MVYRTLASVKSVGRSMKIYGEKAEQSEMIYPQNVQKWYTESGLFPLWITGGGTAVISFEGLKPEPD